MSGPSTPPRPTATLLSTSDRYDLEWELDTLRSLPDIDVTLISGMPSTEAELIALAQDVDGILLSSRDRMSRLAMSSLPRCRVVSRYAVGLDHLDLAAATEHGIVVTHFPGYCTQEVADHALGLILTLNRRIAQLDRDLRAGAWSDHAHHMDRLLRGPIPAMRDLTVGVVGLGRIGRAVVARLRPFGCRVVVCDPYVDDAAIAGAGAESVAMAELLATADIVTLHCPLTAETTGLIDEAALRAMRPGSSLVNTARGPLVDLDALSRAVGDGHVGGAALDVVDPEPLPPDSPLWLLDNVILTPHSAYYSERSVEVVRIETLEAALDVLRGRRPKVVANPAVLDRLDLAPRDDG